MAEMIEGFSKIAPYLSEHLVLGGFVVFVSFLLAWALVRARIIPGLTGKQAFA